MRKLAAVDPRPFYRSLSPSDVKSIGEQISDLNAQFTLNEPQWRFRGANEFAVIQRDAAVLLQAHQRHASRNGTVSRDAMMADNIRWIRSQEGARAGIVVWAHNDHVAHRLPRVMGAVLRQQFPREYVAIGFSFDDGAIVQFDPEIERLRVRRVAHAKRGSLDAELAHAGPDCFFLPLFGAPRQILSWLSRVRDRRSIGSTWFGNDRSYRSTIPAEDFDAIIFVRRVSPSHPLWGLR